MWSFLAGRATLRRAFTAFQSIVITGCLLLLMSTSLHHLLVSVEMLPTKGPRLILSHLQVRQLQR